LELAIAKQQNLTATFPQQDRKMISCYRKKLLYISAVYNTVEVVAVSDPNDHLILFSLAEEGDWGGTGEQPGRVVAQLGQLTVVVTLTQLKIKTISHGLF
jgi:hypothetical protein